MLLNGSEKADTLTGGADADTLYGFGGNDKLTGGAGDDVLAGMAGNDTLLGGDGEDYILGGAGSDTIDGGAGADWAAYEDAASGVKVDLTLTASQNTLGGGSDKLVSIENLYGSAFNDTLIGDAGVNYLAGGDGNDSLSGGKGEDNLFGGAGADTLLGGQNDDYMQGGAGNDLIDGGAGVDWSAYDDATAGVTVDLNLTTAQNTGGGGVDKLVGVENVYGSAFNDVLTGDAGGNTLVGDAGNDTLNGGAGDDFFLGGTGVDSFDGGDGHDTVSYATAMGPVQIHLGFIQQGVGAGWFESRESLTSIEALLGSDFDDVFTGNTAENYLAGGLGNDSLSGFGPNDVLDGGAGNDSLSAGGPWAFLVDATGTFMSGGEGRDTLTLGLGDMRAEGGLGDDDFQLDNIAGHKVLIGDDGVDRLFLQNFIGFGVDFTTGVTLDLSSTARQQLSSILSVTVDSIESVWGTDLGDQLTGTSADNFLGGGGGDDLLVGGAGADTLDGGVAGGNDTLIGGTGYDAMWGGSGTDTFVFADGDSRAIDTTGAGVDVIGDFTANDELRFSDAPAGFSYVESSAGSFASALATVNSMLTNPSTFHEYIAFQVGADVYVFSGHADPSGAGLENVILLAGVNLEAISYDTFL